jgi:hypothetical protein
MKGFIQGITSIGNLFPPNEEAPKTNVYSAWHDVGKAFKAVSNSFRWAMREFDKEITEHGQRPKQ